MAEQELVNAALEADGARHLVQSLTQSVRVLDALTITSATVSGVSRRLPFQASKKPSQP